MTHPTYTHPGANAALLALSRALRRCTLARRDISSARGNWKQRCDMYVEQTAAWEAVFAARSKLREINRRFSS